MGGGAGVFKDYFLGFGSPDPSGRDAPIIVETEPEARMFFGAVRGLGLPDGAERSLQTPLALGIVEARRLRPGGWAYRGLKLRRWIKT